MKHFKFALAGLAGIAALAAAAPSGNNEACQPFLNDGDIK
jgi:hypothetical protein